MKLIKLIKVLEVHVLVCVEMLEMWKFGHCIHQPNTHAGNIKYLTEVYMSIIDFT